MSNNSDIQPVDYLVIGHITVDLTPKGPVIGGSVSYAALTAKALGLRVGIVTEFGNELPLKDFDGIQIISGNTNKSTTFENVYTPGGRIQYLRHAAPKINLNSVPEQWKKTRIIHLAPVAQEVNCQLSDGFQPELLGLTPQGWMRNWDETGRVSSSKWDAPEAINQSGVVIFSVEDVGRDEEVIETMSHHSRVMAVTEGELGVRLFWHGDIRRFKPPVVTEVDPTGAGDIFAASFFIRLLNTRDPWEAARFANRMAAISVTRPGITGVPSPAEADRCMVEVLN